MKSDMNKATVQIKYYEFPDDSRPEYEDVEMVIKTDERYHAEGWFIIELDGKMYVANKRLLTTMIDAI